MNVGKLTSFLNWGDNSKVAHLLGGFPLTLFPTDTIETALHRWLENDTYFHNFSSKKQTSTLSKV
jgi:hypothetical protein